MMEYEFNRRLIDLVSQDTSIWDTSLKQHKDKSVTECAWRDISSHLLVSPDRCQRRWTSLRTQYSRKHKKRSEVPSGSAASVPEHWVYYTQMSFLDQVVRHKSTVDNFVFAEDNADVSVYLSSDDGDVDVVQPDISAESSLRKDNNSRKRAYRGTEKTRVQEEMVKLLQKSTEEVGKLQDQYSSFGDFISDQLRSMPIDEAKSKMKLISEIIFQ